MSVATKRADTYQLIEAECQRNDQRWGADRTQDWGLWSLILGEEVGELQQAMLEDAMGTRPATLRGMDLRHIIAEATQVAAVAVEIIRDAQRRRAGLEGA